MVRGCYTQKFAHLCLLTLYGVTPDVAYSGSTGRAIKDDSDKVAAPTKEDSADYFAAARKDVPSEDKKKADELRGKTIDQIKAILASKKGKMNSSCCCDLESYISNARTIKGIKKSSTGCFSTRSGRTQIQKFGASNQSQIIKLPNRNCIWP